MTPTRDPAAQPAVYATLTDLSGHPVSVHAAASWAAVQGVYVTARDRSGRDYRPALLGVEEARMVRDALDTYLREMGEANP